MATTTRKDELRSWVRNNQSGQSGCRTCTHPAAETIRLLLTIMIEDQIRPSNKAFFSRVLDEHPDYIKCAKNERRMFDHIRSCEAELWSKLPGRHQRQ